jgi:hypothetical protein
MPTPRSTLLKLQASSSNAALPTWVRPFMINLSSVTWYSRVAACLRLGYRRDVGFVLERNSTTGQTVMVRSSQMYDACIPHERFFR